MSKKKFSPWRAISVAGAALILAAQLVSAVHFHQAAATSQFNLDEGICPICELAFHSPGSISAAPAIMRGPVPVEIAAIRQLPAVHAAVFAPERGRAPPVSQSA
ncbi:MAG TPA: hypothetical protein VMT58_08130 [Candidatus Binataceae bacterium]|nr:hypothetical protein [Candidatus Binataceae bacterium]